MIETIRRAAPMPKSTLLAAGLLACALAGHAPISSAWAQPTPDRALVGLSQLRGAVGVLSPEPARSQCGIANGVEGALHGILQGRSEAAGLRMPANTRSITPAAGHVIVAGIPPVTGLPVLLGNFSVVALGTGADVVCASSLVMQLRARVSGQVTATNAPLQQDLILWSDDATNISRPAEIPGVLREQLQSMMERFATQYRQQQPQAQSQAGMPGPKARN
jgi:hypothetical protein